MLTWRFITQHCKRVCGLFEGAFIREGGIKIQCNEQNRRTLFYKLLRISLLTSVLGQSALLRNSVVGMSDSANSSSRSTT